MRVKHIIAAAGWVALCEVVGAVGAYFTTPAIGGWYAALARPALSPPNWVFAPVWTLLYALMGVAAYFVWRAAASKRRHDALVVFLLQLALNALWSALFFGLRSPALGLLCIAALWLAIVWTIVLFARVSRPAAWLLLPYLLWVTFAAYLNAALWLLN